MSLATQIASLATRIGAEVKAVRAVAVAKPDTYVQSTAPASPKTGDVWVDTSTSI